MSSINCRKDLELKPYPWFGFAGAVCPADVLPVTNVRPGSANCRSRVQQFVVDVAGRQNGDPMTSIRAAGPPLPEVRKPYELAKDAMTSFGAGVVVHS